jgi:hypothetical protein
MKIIKTFLVISFVMISAGAAFGQNIEPMFSTDVKIYLHKIGVAPNGPADTALRPVERVVPVREKLEHTLYALFDEEIPEAEQEEGFVSPTYGTKFEGVSVRNGVATVRFSEIRGFEMERSLGSFIFADAITKTVKQFRSIKRVEICAVGKTTIDEDRPFPRCQLGRRR